MFQLLGSTFFEGPALISFSNEIEELNFTSHETVTKVGGYFVNDRARRVNDEIWQELTF